MTAKRSTKVPKAFEEANRVVFMDDGLVVEEGPPPRLLGQPQHERTRSFLDKVL